MSVNIQPRNRNPKKLPPREEAIPLLAELVPLIAAKQKRVERLTKAANERKKATLKPEKELLQKQRRAKADLTADPNDKAAKKQLADAEKEHHSVVEAKADNVAQLREDMLVLSQEKSERSTLKTNAHNLEAQVAAFEERALVDGLNFDSPLGDLRVALARRIFHKSNGVDTDRFALVALQYLMGTDTPRAAMEAIRTIAEEFKRDLDAEVAAYTEPKGAA